MQKQEHMDQVEMYLEEFWTSHSTLHNARMATHTRCVTHLNQTFSKVL